MSQQVIRDYKKRNLTLHRATHRFIYFYKGIHKKHVNCFIGNQENTIKFRKNILEAAYDKGGGNYVINIGSAELPDIMN